MTSPGAVLPEYATRPHKECSPLCSGCKTALALAIAWEALESTSKIMGDGCLYCSSGSKSNAALRRIAALGDEAKPNIEELGK